MTPEDKDSLRTGMRSLKAKLEKPFHVSLHPPHVINPSCPIFGIQYARTVDAIAPDNPNPNLTVKSHDRKMWIAIEPAAKYVIMRFLLCAWRNICEVYDAIDENNTGTNHREISPATWAISVSCPNSRRIGVVNKNIGSKQIEQHNNMIHDLCRYTPSIWYCPAPYAWPQRVSSALAIPNCKEQMELS